MALIQAMEFCRANNIKSSVITHNPENYGVLDRKTRLHMQPNTTPHHRTQTQPTTCGNCSKIKHFPIINNPQRHAFSES